MKAGNISYERPTDIAEIVPVFPLTGALLLPGGQMPLNIFEPRYLEMVDDALGGEKLIGIVQPCLKGETNPDGSPKLSEIGCLGRVTTFQETGDGRYLINLSGICRFKVKDEIHVNTAYRQCNIEAIESDLSADENDGDVDRDAVLTAFRNYLDANKIEADWDVIRETDNHTLINALCMMSPYDAAEKQALLEAEDLKKRAETLIAISEFHLAHDGGEKASKLN